MNDVTVLTGIVTALILIIILWNRQDSANHREFVHKRLGELQISLNNILIGLGRLEGRFDQKDKDHG